MLCQADDQSTFAGDVHRTDNNSTSSSTPITIDLIASVSGQNSDLGNWNYNGVKLAVDQANAKGGINGRKLEINKLDDQGQPTVGTDLARRAQADKASMVYGSDLSSVTLAMIRS